MRTLIRAAAVCCAVLTSASASAQTAPAPSAPVIASPTAVGPDGPQTAATDAVPVVPSFGSIFTSLGGDFRRLPSRQTLIVLGIAGSASLAVSPSDHAVSQDVGGSIGFDHLFEPGEGIGGGVAQGGAALAAYAIGRAVHSPAMARLGSDLIQAQIVSSVLTQGIKFAVNRERPDGSSYSFPSGHTSSSFATATVLQQHFGWKAGLPAYGLASWVAGSRVQERRHYLSDVIFGAAIGIVSAHAVTLGHGAATFAMAPVAAPGGAGVSVVWVGRHTR